MDTKQTLISLLRKLTRFQRTTRGLSKPYITGLSEESKSLYEAYKQQYMSNPFDSTTQDIGNELINKMSAENKRRWEEREKKKYMRI